MTFSTAPPLLRLAILLLTMAMGLAPNRILAKGEGIMDPLPLDYVVPARSLAAGSGAVDVHVAGYRLYSSLSPSGQAAAEERVVTARLRLSVGVTDRLDLWVEPCLRQLRWSSQAGDETATGLGDTRLGIRLGPPRVESLLRLGAALTVLLPTGRDRGRDRLGDFTSGVADYSLMALCDVDLSRFFGRRRCVVYLNCGYRWRGDEEGGSLIWPDVYPAVAGEDDRFNDPLLLRLGWRYTASTVSLECEFRGDQLIHARHAVRPAENPMSLGAGLRKRMGGRFWVRVSGEVALSSDDPGTSVLPEPERAFPDWAMAVAFGGGWGPS